MPEIQPPTFGDEPRKESPGERQQRFAGLINLAANGLGISIPPVEREKIALFIDRVIGQLTPAQQKALSELVGKTVGWIVDYMAERK